MSGISPSDRLTPTDDAAGRTVYYDEQRGTYHVWWEKDDHESLSTNVVLAVSAVRDVDPRTLEPLSARVDPDALDAIFADRDNGIARADEGAVSFSFAGCDVTVRADGEIVLEPPAEA
jgi:hypothetical protein